MQETTCYQPDIRRIIVFIDLETPRLVLKSIGYDDADFI